MRLATLGLTIFFLAPSSAIATTALEMREWCRPLVGSAAGPDSFESGYCIGSFITLNNVLAWMASPTSARHSMLLLTI